MCWNLNAFLFSLGGSFLWFVSVSYLFSWEGAVRWLIWIKFYSLDAISCQSNGCYFISIKGLYCMQWFIRIFCFWLASFAYKYVILKILEIYWNLSLKMGFLDEETPNIIVAYNHLVPLDAFIWVMMSLEWGRAIEAWARALGSRHDEESWAKLSSIKALWAS